MARARALAARQAAGPVHDGAAPAGGAAVPTAREAKGPNRSRPGGAIVSMLEATRSLILIRGTRLVLGIALVSAALIAVAFVLGLASRNRTHRAARSRLFRLHARSRGRKPCQAGQLPDCHTAEQGAPFAGGRALATPFGTIYATNITPDRRPASAPGRATPSGARCARHRPRRRAPLSRLSLRPLHPCRATTTSTPSTPS